MTLPRKGLLLIAAPVCFQIVLLGFLSAIESSRESDRRAEVRAKEILASSYRLQALMVDVETGTRGYLLTQETRFFEPADAAFRRIRGELQRLRTLALTAEEAAAVARVDRAAAVVMAYHNNLRELVENGRLHVALAATRAGRGKALMDAFRAEMNRFLRAEESLDAERAAAALGASHRLVQALAIGSVATIVLTLVLIAAFGRSIARRFRVLVENTARFERGLPLHAAQPGSDEIAEVDRHFHAMAAAVAKGRRELETANQELESFSYSVSHDLRAPLRAVNGYAQMLEEDYAGTLGAEGQRYLATIRAEAHRMGALIDDLLSFSRLGRGQLRMQPVDVAALARRVFTELQAASPGRAMRLDCGELPLAMGDEAMIRQALVNLLTNAVKFSAPREEIVVEVGAEAGDDMHGYWVRDHGVGFDPRYSNKLFGVFQRLHDSAEFEGTGVGLAIVQRVVERHGGRVRAEGAVNEGACFHFTLPAAATARRAA
ncbi:MAG TPA: ATP-binding protein [Thermoanaerobaculia bacterium]|nr:ATP-binding protein [Thermoanaerobaculia bacterium]